LYRKKLKSTQFQREIWTVRYGKDKNRFESAVPPAKNGSKSVRIRRFDQKPVKHGIVISMPSDAR